MGPVRNVLATSSRVRTGTATRVFYGLGSVAFGVKDNGFAFLLLLYYNQVLGLPEGWVGFGIMAALVADACFDPVVGYLSDHLHSPWGRRHPFMYAAAVPVAFAYFLLWSPPAGLPPPALFAYFLATAVLVRLLIACYEIPSASLVAELTDHYDERTAILSYRFFFGWWGGLTMAVLAYAVFLRPDAEHPVGVLNPEGYRYYGLASALVMAAAMVASAAGTHHTIPRLRRPAGRRERGLRATLRELRQTFANRAFRTLFAAGIFLNMASGLSAALSIYFNTFFWELDAAGMSLLAGVSFVSAAIAAVVTPRLSFRLGKKQAAVGTGLAVVVLGPLPIVLRLAGAFPANGAPLLLPVLAAHGVLVVALFIMASILVAAMVADVVEDSEVTTGRRAEGVFFAASAFVQKATSGIGIFASTLLLGAIGFPRGAQPGGVPPEVVRDLGLVFAPVLVALYLVALGFLSAYRISRDSHEATLRRLGRGQEAAEG